MKVQFGGIKFAERTFVRALRVCMNKDNTCIKGLQIRGRKIDENGNVSDLPARYPDSSSSSGLTPLVDLNAPSDQRPNCDGWKKWVECSQNQIATAITAHFSAAGSGFPNVIHMPDTRINFVPPMIPHMHNIKNPVSDPCSFFSCCL